MKKLHTSPEMLVGMYWKVLLSATLKIQYVLVEKSLEKQQKTSKEVDSDARFMEGFISGVQLFCVIWLCCSIVVSESCVKDRKVWLLSCIAQSSALWAAIVNWSKAGRHELHYCITTRTGVLSTAVFLQRE